MFFELLVARLPISLMIYVSHSQGYTACLQRVPSHLTLEATVNLTAPPTLCIFLTFQNLSAKIVQLSLKGSHSHKKELHLWILLMQDHLSHLTIVPICASFHVLTEIFRKPRKIM